MGPLVVEFLDEEVEVASGESLTFGRDANLVIDPDNQHLHRVLGSFVSRGDGWVLHNVGRFITMVVLDNTSRSEIRPGGRMALLSESFTVAFSAGPARYEIRGRQRVAEVTAVPGAGPSDTTDVARYRLNAEQRQMVLAMAEPLLRADPGWPSTMPTNRAVATRLGWSTAKLNRKLDYLCSRLAESGVAGMVGDSDRRANARRVHLVEFLVANQVVGPEELEVASGTGSGPGEDAPDVGPSHRAVRSDG